MFLFPVYGIVFIWNVFYISINRIRNKNNA
nr:MAG TPA: hypothetical protein [Caudoviricetes sp.]